MVFLNCYYNFEQKSYNIFDIKKKVQLNIVNYNLYIYYH